MSKEAALEFLKHMSSDPQTRTRVVDEYKGLLREPASERGFAFDEAELADAAQALTDVAAGEMGDAAVAMINGGIVCFPPEGGVNAPAHGGTIDAPGIF
jgi:hypothetical protein